MRGTMFRRSERLLLESKEPPMTTPFDLQHILESYCRCPETEADGRISNWVLFATLAVWACATVVALVW